MVKQDASVLLQRIVALEAENAMLRAAQEAAAAMEGRRSAMLMAAVQHRIRNMLAAVRAFASRAASGGITVEEFVAHLAGRIDTLTRLHAALTRTDGGGLDLEELVREEFVAQGGFGPDQVEVEGASVTVRGQTAELLGLALHELVVNAVKFGALSTGTGRVAVRWRVAPPPQNRLLLSWSESGASAPTGEGRRGFGRELIEDGLPYQLAARTSIEFRPGGILCAIDLPVGPAEDHAGASLALDVAP